MPDPQPQPAHLVASLGGAGLAAATRALAAARPAAKPLHPRGAVVLGRLERVGGHHTGAGWLDAAGDDEVLVRRSRALGLPSGCPDIHGLAVRIPVDGAADRFGDLLLATTGHGRLTRFLLTAGASPYSRPLTTLLPYRTPGGPVLIAALATGDSTYDLGYASPRGRWQLFGTLTLSEVDGPDPLISFDPVRHVLPGLDNYEWVRRLREPAYGTARRSR